MLAHAVRYLNDPAARPRAFPLIDVDRFAVGRRRSSGVIRPWSWVMSLAQSKLFSAKYRLALFPERLHALLRIRRSGDGGKGLRLVLHLTFQ